MNDSRISTKNRAHVLAQEWKAQILRGEWGKDGSLPSVRTLALRCGASKSTVSQALAKLRKLGLLIMDQPQWGFRLPNEIPRRNGISGSKPGAGSRRHRSALICATLRDEILSGQFPAGTRLPSLKELCHRFHCAHASIRTAINDLQAQGLLVPQAGGLQASIPRSHVVSAQSRVHLSLDARNLAPHVTRLAVAIEKELLRMGWGMAAKLGSCHNDPVRDPGRASRDESPVAGHIHVKTAPTEPWRDYFLTRPRIPLVAIDADEILGWDRKVFASHRQFHNVSLDNRKAGRDVALHLYALGHRSIGIFSQFPLLFNRWTGLRVGGLEEVYPVAEEGRELRSRTFVLPAGVESTSAEAKRIRAEISGFRKSLSKTKTLHPALLKVAFHGMEAVYSSLEAADRMEALFQTAVRERDITAWICINDVLACAALAFLRQNGLNAPQDISLVAFDNSSLSYHMDLTSYDMGLERAASMAIQCLAHPRLVPSDARGHVLVPGQLLVRGTSAKPAARGPG